MKQDTLADALHYSSRTSISHIERGREDPPLTKILACALELGVHPHELFLEEPHEDVSPNLIGFQNVAPAAACQPNRRE